MQTEDRLAQRYGVLMTLGDLATVFKRSQDGLRMTMHSKSELGRQLSRAKLRIGRRVHFKTADIAKIIDGKTL